MTPQSVKNIPNKKNIHKGLQLEFEISQQIMITGMI